MGMYGLGFGVLGFRHAALLARELFRLGFRVYRDIEGFSGLIWALPRNIRRFREQVGRMRWTRQFKLRLLIAGLKLLVFCALI